MRLSSKIIEEHHSDLFKGAYDFFNVVFYRISLTLKKVLNPFFMDNLTPEQRAKTMSAIRSTNTKGEVRLAKALWNLGYRYRKNNRTIFGTPDLTFKKLKIAIFVDSEFFHGKDWETQKQRIKSNTDYWYKKIERNRQRDVEVNNYLESQNWKVIRFWSREIEKKLEDCIATIQQEIALLQEQG